MVFSFSQSKTDWESTFKNWTKPSSDTEETKCDNAVSMIRSAIDASPALQDYRIDVVAVGSYPNNTNVRLNSDVDVCVRLRDTMFWDCPSGVTASQLGITVPASYPYPDFVRDVGKALEKKFGWHVDKGNKVFAIRENTYRVNADVSVALEYRYYGSADPSHYIQPVGYEFRTEDGNRVINWHDQHKANGTQKNKATGGRYKYTVRILKRLKDQIGDEDLLWILDDANIPSYLIECLVWNVPDEYFNLSDYTSIVQGVLAYIYNATMSQEKCAGWTEVNRIKALFSPQQKWTWQKAHAFADRAWNHLGFE